MRQHLFAASILMISAALAHAQATSKYVQVKATRYKAAKGQAVILIAQAKSNWDLATDLVATLEAGESSAVFRSDVEGDHIVTAQSSGPATRFIVTVGGDSVPPTPPSPPGPASPLTKKLQEAYDADKSPKKSERLKDMIELYRQAQDFADQPANKTTGQLASKVVTTQTDLMKDDPSVILEVRKIIAAELKAEFPNSIALTDDLRKAAKAKFKAIQDALSGVKP